MKNEEDEMYAEIQRLRSENFIKMQTQAKELATAEKRRIERDSPFSAGLLRLKPWTAWAVKWPVIALCILIISGIGVYFFFMRN